MRHFQLSYILYSNIVLYQTNQQEITDLTYIKTQLKERKKMIS